MWWNSWNSWNPNGNGAFPPVFFNGNGDRDRVKEGNEYYRVYVNDDYVGDKECIAQGDGGSSSVEDYLKSRGFDGLNIQTEGNQIRIQTDPGDPAEDIKRHLSVYLNIR